MSQWLEFPPQRGIRPRTCGETVHPPIFGSQLFPYLLKYRTQFPIYCTDLEVKWVNDLVTSISGTRLTRRPDVSVTLAFPMPLALALFIS